MILVRKMPKKKITKNVTKVVPFSIAFGFVEAAAVVYLREIFGLGKGYLEADRQDILLAFPGVTFLKSQAALKLLSDKTILNIEKIREVATLLMLASLTALAGKKLKEKIAYFFLAFGIWDISYYIFLKLTIGWPKSLSDLDIFFLLPVAWAGPVFVPVVISAILVLGSFVYLKENKY